MVDANALLGLLPLGWGLFQVVAPVRVSRVFYLLNQGKPGEMIPHADPERVRTSSKLRWQLRLGGAGMAGLGAIIVLGGLRLI